MTDHARCLLPLLRPPMLRRPCLPDTGRRLHMATCPAGKAHDRTVSGFDADTAINPAAISDDDPQATAPIISGVRR